MLIWQLMITGGNAETKKAAHIDSALRSSTTEKVMGYRKP
jgi:hypothetical protein